MDFAIEVTPHLGILGLQESDVLMARLVVVIKIADAGFLLILKDLLPQYLQLKFHEVDLLLEVDDVVVRVVLVGVFAESTRILLFLLLTSELHSYASVVAGVVAK